MYVYISAPKTILNRVTGQVNEGQSPFSESPVPRSSGEPELIHRESIYPLLARQRDMKVNLRAENKKDMLELNLGRPYMPD